MSELVAVDHQLVEHARTVLDEYYNPDRHTTGAAVRTASDRLYTAVSFKAGTDKASMHAEPLAVARAVIDGETDIRTVVAVQPRSTDSGRTRVVSACGVCREFLTVHAPEIEVIVSRNDELRKVPIDHLLPY